MAAKVGPLALNQVLAIAAAAITLSVIFVPFQQANAFTVTTTLPNAVGGTINNSASGENFQITITIDNTELISIQSVILILDNGQPSVKKATFDSAGNLASGDNTLVKNNHLTISPVAADNGYGYGYGSVSNGITGFSGYSYSFSSTNGFISGNSGGPNNPVTNPVTGLLGPGSITITGKIRTADLAPGSHTLDVLIDTGAGGPKNHLSAPQLSFTVNTNNNVVSVSVSVPANTPVNINIPSAGAQVSISFGGGGGTGSVVVEKKTPSTLNAQIPTAFTSVSASTATLIVSGSTVTTVGDVYEFDISAVNHTGSVTVTIPYNPALVPSGQSPTLFRWTGTAWEQATNVSFTSNTVTGTFSGLSPVVAGVFTSSSTTGSVGGGGAGGHRGPVILGSPVITLPDTYFDKFPLQRLQIANSAFLNVAGASVTQAQVNQQVSISADFTNYQQKDQSYAFIVQVVAPEGYVTDLRWQEGKLGPGQTTDVSTSVTLGEAGVYKVQIFILDGLGDMPRILAEPTVKNLRVTE